MTAILNSACGFAAERKRLNSTLMGIPFKAINTFFRELAVLLTIHKTPLTGNAGRGQVRQVAHAMGVGGSLQLNVLYFTASSPPTRLRPLAPPPCKTSHHQNIRNSSEINFKFPWNH